MMVAGDEEVIVIEGGGWERVLRVVDDAQIEHWQIHTDAQSGCHQ